MGSEDNSTTVAAAENTVKSMKMPSIKDICAYTFLYTVFICSTLEPTYYNTALHITIIARCKYIKKEII